MAFTNVSKPTTSIANVTKVNTGETWASILTTWATETHDWQTVSQLLTNSSKPAFGYLWGASSLPWLESSPWDDVFSGITNISKPS